MKPKDRDWHAGRRTKYENGFPWAKCPTLATRLPDADLRRRAQVTQNHQARSTARASDSRCLTRLTGPKRALPDGYPAAPAVPLLLPIVIVTLTGLEIPVKSTGRAAALNT